MPSEAKPFFWGLLYGILLLFFVYAVGLATRLFPITWNNSLIGAAIGGTLALVGSVVATMMAVHFAERKRVREESASLLRLYQTLHDEFEITWNLFNNNYGPAITELTENDMLDAHFPISGELFPLYIANANLIGGIPDNDLRKCIITAHKMAESMAESLRYNNSLLAERENIEHPPGDGPIDNTRLEKIQRQLIKYAKGVKNLHETLGDSVPPLLVSLKEKINSPAH